MFLQLRHKFLISLFPDITDCLIALFDGSLGRKGDMGRFEFTSDLVDPSDGFFIQRGNLGRRCAVGEVDVRDYFDGLIYVVEDDKGGSDHEECFRKTGDRVGKRGGGFGDGFKVGYRIVGDKSNCAAYTFSSSLR